ncbi:DUF3413 domain-containing protein [Photobacterium sp. GJ3]|uniref:DUF3413 domain-containing protein n=1 Tax=Photobacterium sp. GJ3 TaxID=2829502 RepID=UPI001B8B6B26|nr:DUF3413 domain-containing protein [Photobacterium sp. GJ3]QUJ68285.1 DUF3413 domain-containing protein [Photobacterium sp. GJ3]
MVASGNNYKETVSQLISWGHWFSFFNIIAAMLLGTRYIIHSDWPETLMGQLYLGLSWVGHFGFLVFGFYILILFPASFLIPSQRLMRLFAVLVGTIGQTVLLLDTHAYESLELHISPLVWDLLLSGERTDLNAKWQYLFIVVPAIFLLQLFLSEWLWRKLRKLTRKHVGVPIAAVFGLCFLASHLIYIWADANLYRPVTAQRSNFPLSYPMTAKTFMERHGLLDRQEYTRLREEQGVENSENIRYPLKPLSFSDKGTGQNLLVIMVDGLRSDMVNAETMPYLNAFAHQNLNFANHYSTGNDSTLGTFGLFYGLPGAYSNSIRAEHNQPVLLDTLHKRGYRFGLFSGSGFADPIYQQTVFTQAQLSLAAELARDETGDQAAIADMQSWLSKQTAGNPWFGYLELTDVQNYEETGENHSAQFQPSLTTSADESVKNHQTNASPAELLKNTYRNAAYYVDEQLIQIFDSLIERNLLNNTIVVITANHGMEFNETGTNSWGSGTNYSQYQLKVPLIIHWPGSQAAQITRATSHLDIVPTLMETLLSTTTVPEFYSSGISLFDNSSKRRWVLAGDTSDIVVVQPESTTIVDRYGNYTVYDPDYKMKDDGKPKLSTLMQVLHELKRFYQQNP